MSSYVRIQVTGPTTFAPVAALVNGSAATLSWAVEGGSTTTGLTPSITLGSATSYIDLSASGGNGLADITLLNFGYNNDDDLSIYSIGTSYNLSPQAIAGITDINLLTGLLIFCAAHTPLTGTADFTDMSSLQHIECFQAALSDVILTGCTGLIRLNVEQNNLTSLDLNPVAGNVYDIRIAIQSSDPAGTLTLTPLTESLANDFHFCSRDQIVANMPPLSDFPVIQQLWVYDTDQSGELGPQSSALTDVRASENAYTSANFANQFPTSNGNGFHVTGCYLDMHACCLSSVDLTGCDGLLTIDLSQNALPQAEVDSILATVAAFGTTDGTINLSGNRPPSADGTASAATLTSNGWAVTVDTVDSAARTPGVLADDFNRADATGVANIGNGWFTPDSADADIVSNTLVRTDNVGWQRLLNPGSGLLPADYTVVANIPGATIEGSVYIGLVGRYRLDTSEDVGMGVQVFFNDSTTAEDLYICASRGYLGRTVPTTTLAAFPASWSNYGIDHTFAMQMQGSVITIILDGVAVASGIVTENVALRGTSYGICGAGGNLVWNSIGTISLAEGALAALSL